jgi:hypothetical protein
MFQMCGDGTFPNGISPLENITAFFGRCCLPSLHPTHKVSWENKRRGKINTTTPDQLRELLTESFS